MRDAVGIDRLLSERGVPERDVRRWKATTSVNVPLSLLAAKHFQSFGPDPLLSVARTSKSNDGRYASGRNHPMLASEQGRGHTVSTQVQLPPGGIPPQSTTSPLATVAHDVFWIVAARSPGRSDGSGTLTQMVPAGS